MIQRLMCRIRGHKWVPRGPFIAEPDGGVPIRNWSCGRCNAWDHV